MSTITRKPKVSASSTTPSETDIQRGGSVAAQKPLGTTTLVNLRLPVNVLAQIDQALELRQPKTSRHYWLMEAVLEKLQREGDEREGHV
jgi:hypothetical protein